MCSRLKRMVRYHFDERQQANTQASIIFPIFPVPGNMPHCVFPGTLVFHSGLGIYSCYCWGILLQTIVSCKTYNTNSYCILLSLLDAMAKHAVFLNLLRSFIDMKYDGEILFLLYSQSSQSMRKGIAKPTFCVFQTGVT